MEHCQYCGGVDFRCVDCGQLYTTPRESLIEALYRAKEPVHGSVLVDFVGVSRRQVYYMLSDLVKIGIVEKVGQRRGYRLSAFTRMQMRQVREVARRVA